MQGGLLLSRGEEREAHWDHFRRRLALLRGAGSPDADRRGRLRPRALGRRLRPRRRRRWARRPSWPAAFGVRLALEFQKSSRFCASLDTALALVAQCGSPARRASASTCSTTTPGPSKFEDLAYLSPAEPGLGPGLRPERHAPRAGRRQRPDLAGRGRLPARADPRPPRPDRLRRATSRSRCSTPSSGRSPPTGSPTSATRRSAACWAAGTEQPNRNHGEGPERVDRGDHATRGDRLPRGAVLRLAGLRADRGARAARGPRPGLADPPVGPRRRPAGPQVVDRVLARRWPSAWPCPWCWSSACSR